VQDGRSAVNKVAHIVKENCVAVAINGHMLNWIAKTDGENGAFIQANRHPSGGNCFVLATPSGRKLAGGNGGSGAADALTKGLAEWKELSETEHRALPAGSPVIPAEASRTAPPAGGLIVKAFIRNLKRDEQGNLARIAREDLKNKTQFPDWNPIYIEPSHYHLWLTEAEWKSIIAEAMKLKQGDQFPVPDGIQKRILRYHLLNGTFGLPGAWRLEDIRAGSLMFKLDAASPTLRLRLNGSALLANHSDLDKAERGYDARLQGLLEYDLGRKAVTRFDFVAIGDYWGGDYEGGRFKRPGRTPLGIAFELARGDSAADLAPPLVHMDRKAMYDRYFAAERR
jgi:hypothetical protein